MFGDVVTAVITPFKGNGDVDYAAFQNLLRHLYSQKTDSVVVAGSTGESATLTHEEKVKLFETAVEAAGDLGRVIAGTGTYSTRETIALSREAEKAGVHALMIVTPYYNKPPQDALFYHFAAVAESTRLPLIVYNIPGRTGVNLTPDTVIKLSGIPNIVALKQANGSLEETSLIQKNTALEFSIYSGDDVLTLPFLSIGAEGVISVASHVAGPLISEMIRAFKNGDPRKAYDLHLRLLPLFKALFATTNPILPKAACHLLDLIPNAYLRPPLRAAKPDEIEALKPVLRELNLL